MFVHSFVCLDTRTDSQHEKYDSGALAAFSPTGTVCVVMKPHPAGNTCITELEPHHTLQLMEFQEDR